MARYCIVCGEVPTADYTHPNNMDEAFRWQSMLSEYVSALKLRYHYCVCNKHIDSHKETANKKSCVGERNRNNDSNKQRPNVTFKASNAIHYFGEDQMETPSLASKDFTYTQLSNCSGSQPFSKQLKRNDACTRLLTSLETQAKKMDQKAQPIIPNYEQWSLSDVPSASNSLGITTKRSVSGSDITGQRLLCRCPKPKNNSTVMDKESIRITGCTCGSSCLCGEPSKPKLNLKAARQQQEQKRKRQQQEQLQQQQVLEQQHQECQCNLLVDCRDQAMQFPPNENNRIDKSNDLFECNSTQMSFINTQPAKINVLIMNGSNVPTYYNSSDHHQGDISEICVLESDLAHESAKFLDFDTPTFTMCRTNDPQDNNGKKCEGATEVLLMGTTTDQTDPTTSEDCNNSPSMVQDPQANDELCQELIKRQEARLLELEELLLQQQKLHQSIQTKMNELQSPKKEEPRPKAGGTTVKTMARMTQTIGRSMKK